MMKISTSLPAYKNETLLCSVYPFFHKHTTHAVQSQRDMKGIE